MKAGNEFMIVVDMQNDFVSGALGSDMARAIVPGVAEKIASFITEHGKEWLIFTKDAHGANYADTNEGKHLPVPHCIRGTWGAEIIDELKEFASGAQVIEKRTFGSISLPQVVLDIAEKYCRESARPFDEKDLIFHVFGLCTDICVVSNAMILKANFPESRINVYADCCAGATRESHGAALQTMKMCHMEILGNDAAAGGSGADAPGI